mgnify:FL=1
MAQLRDPAAAGSGSSLLTLARIGMAVGVIVVLALIAWLVRRRKS